ncbi:MAG: superoxide dismutase family protein [Trueperaceae bacterium]
MKHQWHILRWTVLSALLGIGFVQGQTATATVTNAEGTELGVVTFMDTPTGLEVAVTLTDLPPGKHGFHVHSEGSCDTSRDGAGMAVMHGAAGGHFDPYETGNHAGPDVDSHTGHAGDLQNLEVADDGTAIAILSTPKMTVAEGDTSLVGRTIMVHANEDNYSNEPKNGGSGDRIACGVINLP